MPKWCKLIIALALLPVCFGAGAALWQAVRVWGTVESLWLPFLCGAACWLGIYLLLPKPMWVYVVGHELTHAVWTWAMGGRVKKFKVSAKGGHVVVTKSNFLIALAPYFFPLYAVLVVLVFLGGRMLWDWHGYAGYFYLLLGVAYAFHLTLTWHILKSSQTDITEHGYLFSAVVIFLGNVSLLLLAIPLLAEQAGVMTALGWWARATEEVFRRLGTLW